MGKMPGRTTGNFGAHGVPKFSCPVPDGTRRFVGPENPRISIDLANVIQDDESE